MSERSDDLERFLDEKMASLFEQMNPAATDLCKRAMAQNLSKAQVRRRVRQALVDAGAKLEAVPNMLAGMDCWLDVKYREKGRGV